jgi:tetratricopeptide (TPR) repeat protein
VAILERLSRDRGRLDASNQDRARRLRVALEDRGQSVLLQYLRGDQIPQSRADFEKGARYFEEALRLAPGAVFDESRLYFCRGRAFIFAKRYEEAKEWLGRSILLDPLHAYAYNALGIAYLEQVPNDAANYARAMAAFRDAVRYAPLWAYPLHNLALTQMQHGDYEAALATYRDAMRLAPEASYLPYNMGLIYQKINRTQEASDSYRVALRTVEANLPQDDVREPRSMIYNAWGSLDASGLHAKQAEKHFRLALADSPLSRNAKHNLALLLSRKGASPEAEALWQQCVAADPAYLPARLSLAEYLKRERRPDEAVAQYRLLLERTPEFAVARVELAKLLASQNKMDDAIAQLQIVVRSTQASAAVFEQLGDMEWKTGNRDAARRSYESGRKLADGSTARRLKRKEASGF